MAAHGSRWQPPLTGTRHLGRTNRFFLGGGKALVTSYHRAAAALGVTVAYDRTAEDLLASGDRCTAVVVSDGAGGQARVAARSVVCASGGVDAHSCLRRRDLGGAAANIPLHGPAGTGGAVLTPLFPRAPSAGRP